MKKLLVTNLVTAVVVLGIIAAYSFKPEQKAGAKYATLTLVDSPDATFIISTVENETARVDLKDTRATKFVEGHKAVYGKVHTELEKLEL